ncbi:MAG: type III PLP-dependent enzyme, partial [Methyloligellaceae bacterium]
LLLETRCTAERFGVTFHVGSQAMEPNRYSEALTQIGALVVKTGVLLDAIDVGGGFPSVYPDLSPPPLDHYMAAIDSSFDALNVVETCELMCEPGRALAAEAGSVILRVEHRRGNTLYLNDGAFGSLFDAAQFGFRYPVALLPTDPRSSEDTEPFVFYGPTCDSFDHMPGPFHLPCSVREGDYIEIGQLGAYGHAMASRFNGFGRYEEVILTDRPMLTMYDDGAGRRGGAPTIGLEA